MPKISFFYIPCSDKAETVKLSNLLLKEQLVACTNTVPIESIYFWEAQVQNDKEQVLITKTLPEKAKAVSRFIEKNHSYDTPCIAFWEINVNDKYFEWVRDSVG